jgi:hypothetical protein
MGRFLLGEMALIRDIDRKCSREKKRKNESFILDKTSMNQDHQVSVVIQGTFCTCCLTSTVDAVAKLEPFSAGESCNLLHPVACLGCVFNIPSQPTYVNLCVAVNSFHDIECLRILQH